MATPKNPIEAAKKDPATRGLLNAGTKMYSKTIGKTPIGKKISKSPIGKLFGLSKKRVWVIIKPDKGKEPAKSLHGKTNTITQRK